MGAWRSLLGTIVEPVATFRALAESPRSLLAVAVLILAHAALPIALSGRVDVKRDVVQSLAESGKLADTTDRDLAEKVEQGQKIQVTKYAVLAVIGPPLRSLLLALVLWLWGRYLWGKPTFSSLWSLATHAQLPLAIRALAEALVISRQTSVLPSEIGTLLPSGLWAWPGLHLTGPAAGILQGVDFFRLWTTVLLGIALYASSRFSPWRAALGMGLAYAAFVAVAFVGAAHAGGA
jgi:hypothetical protein